MVVFHDFCKHADADDEIGDVEGKGADGSEDGPGAFQEGSPGVGEYRRTIDSDDDKVDHHEWEVREIMALFAGRQDVDEACQGYDHRDRNAAVQESKTVGFGEHSVGEGVQDVRDHEGGCAPDKIIGEITVEASEAHEKDVADGGHEHGRKAQPTGRTGPDQRGHKGSERQEHREHKTSRKSEAGKISVQNITTLRKLSV